ncbi:MAG: hypothetical protein HYR91_09880 [Flavobacteriia bacterium]|nr:hypothetical protein [Flavobacteriia bacterium]
MCRYSMARYKPHYACFNCRKTFKRKLMWDINRNEKDNIEAKCPQCSELMANMGLDFESPRKNNLKEWEHIKSLYSVGITFHSCGCSGPGYIPINKEKLIKYFEDIILSYNNHLKFWRTRNEPNNDKEIQREISKNWNYLTEIPNEITSKKGLILNEDAKKYWFQKIKTVEQKLNQIKAK